MTIMLIIKHQKILNGPWRISPWFGKIKPITLDFFFSWQADSTERFHLMGQAFQESLKAPFVTNGTETPAHLYFGQRPAFKKFCAADGNSGNCEIIKRVKTFRRNIRI